MGEVGALHANYWGLVSDESESQNIGKLEPVGPHKVGAYE